MKKSSQIFVKCSQDDKNRFIEACAILGTTQSKICRSALEEAVLLSKRLTRKPEVVSAPDGNSPHTPTSIPSETTSVHIQSSKSIPRLKAVALDVKR
jgi:hypothetical protein